jgi:hypothetical protein
LSSGVGRQLIWDTNDRALWSFGGNNPTGASSASKD